MERASFLGPAKLTLAFVFAILTSTHATAAPWSGLKSFFVRGTKASAPESSASLPNETLLQMIRKDRRSYIKPNEKDPWDMIDVTMQAPSGALISVGTERGLISAALNKQVTKLIQIDSDPAVVLFNRINTKLILAAPNLSEYRQLRFQANYPAVLEDLKARNLDLSEAEFNWWTSVARDEAAFSSVTYLKSDRQFARLKSLSEGGLIRSELVDFTDPEAVQRVATATLAGAPISMVDLSNAWWDYYGGLKGTATVMKSLAANLRPNSLLILTHYRPSSKRFDYFGFTWSYIHRDWKTIAYRLQSVAEKSMRVDIDPAILQSIDFGPPDRRCGFKL